MPHLIQKLASCWSAAAALAAVAGPVLREFLKRRRKSQMSDLPDIAAAAAPAPAVIVPSAAQAEPAAAAAADAPIAVAPADAPAPVNSAAVVSSVVQTVTTHPAVPAEHAANIIASILSGLYQAEPAIFAVTRASAGTQAKVGLGLGLAEVIVSAFLHPAG